MISLQNILLMLCGTKHSLLEKGAICLWKKLRWCAAKEEGIGIILDLHLISVLSNDFGHWAILGRLWPI